MKPLYLENVKEIGTLEDYQKINQEYNHTRFFNQIEIFDNVVYKRSIDNKFDHLIQKEINWYKKVSGCKNIPLLLGEDPLAIQFIDGLHPFEIQKDKLELVKVIINRLQKLHQLEVKEVDTDELKEVYLNKTLGRINHIKDLIPNLESEYLIINNLKCENIFAENKLECFKQNIDFLFNLDKFNLIHGDPTFSNTLIKNKEPYFIDPRGYFGKKDFYGDRYYDFAKLYYSAIGNYDQFNRRNFILQIDDDKINLEITSNQYEDTELIFKDFFDGGEMRRIKLLHALIWLSLSGYVVDDVDSILGSFYNGLYYYQKYINEYL